MNTISDALADVGRAFKHLEFAIKLMCYIEADHIDRAKFDTDVTLLLDNQNISFPTDTFQSSESLVLAAKANVGVCFGVSAIVLDAAFEAADIKRNPDSDSSNDLLRTLVYMIRCAFAHNPAMPCWKVHGSYSRKLSLLVEGKNISVNLPQLHRKGFEYEHIGGLANWYRIRRLSERLINDT